MRAAWIGCLLLLHPLAATAESWALLGLREVDGRLVATDLETVRGLLAERVPVGDVVLSAGEVAERLGLARGPAPDPATALAEAELLFFQLEYAAALARLAEAIDAVAWGRVDASPELGRSLRLLAAQIHLLSGERDRAAALLEPLAAAAPLPESARRAIGGEVAALWDEVRAAAASRAEGWLVVDCTGCHGGEVWIEGAPLGTTQQSIGLLPGTYRVVLRGLAGSSGKRSLGRQVRIRPGAETRISIELAVEAALVPDGPSLLDEGEVSFRRAASLALRIGADRLLVWRFAPEATEVREVGPGGEYGRWVARHANDEAERARRDLVEAIVRGEPEVGAEAAAPLVTGVPAARATDPMPTPAAGFSAVAPEGDVVSHARTDAVEERQPAHETPGLELAPKDLPEEEPPFLRRDDDGGPRLAPALRWSALGATVAMIAAAAWLGLDAAAAEDELDRLEGGRGSYRSVQEARRAAEVAQSVETKRTWSAVLWGGAAAGAAGTVLLFLHGE